MWQELNKAFGKRNSEIAAKAKEVTAKAVAEKTKKEAAEDALALKRIAHAKNTKVFTVGWATGGHPEVHLVNTLDDLAKHFADNKDPFKEPFMVKAVDITAERLVTNWQQWRKSCPTYCQEINIDKAQAELDAAKGGQEIQELLQKVLPAELQFTGGLPSV